MIITKLIGGNGNQMFQYAAGLALAKKHDTELLIDNYYLLDKSKRYFRHEHRDYALDMFNITAKVADSKQISQFTIPRKGNKYIYHLKKRLFRQHNVFLENNLISPDALFDLPKQAYLEGYWQNTLYFKGIESVIKSEFSFKNVLPESCSAFREKIIEEYSVAVVFRRGDFVNHPVLDIVKLDFYYDALEIISEKLGSPKLFVFSDDIEWCQNNFKPKGCKPTFVDQSLTGPNAEYYLHMITLCKHFIIPNSTFGWWGAWLGNYPDKIVIAPKKWFINQIEPVNSIIPDTWIVL